MTSPTQLPFSEKDLQYIRSTGRQVVSAKSQLERYSTGFPPMRLIRPVGDGDGMFQKPSVAKVQKLIELFDQKASQLRICKFSPASGAASRMFRSLYAFLTAPDQLSAKQQAEVDKVCGHLEDFAFYGALKDSLMKSGKSIDELVQAGKFDMIIGHLLSEGGLHFGQMPKALLPFHQYDDFTRTALEEHLVEAAQYARSEGNLVWVHFTVSSEHQALFDSILKEVVPAYESTFSCKFRISTSIQLAETDTLAATMDNQPFRDENGRLVFRPGGHGALLENLNRIDADCVFIKNIDNVLPDKLKAETIHWKRLIGGLLVYFQNQVFQWLHRLDQGEAFLEGEVIEFMSEELCITFPPDYEDWEEEIRLSYLHTKLNRPIRVCGVIKTDKNTGGGPFWVEEDDHSHSIQLVETAQIDLEDETQKRISYQSGFANITDLICSLRTYQGEAFDLLEFRNEDTGFITQKSYNGRDLQALELPGLWNGAMADWTTILVEVPLSTFNPVKTVGDLLGKIRVN